MIVSDILKNSNFSAEFPYVIRTANDYGEIIFEFKSWEDELPGEVLESEIIWLDVVNGYADMSNMACMIIDIFQPEID